MSIKKEILNETSLPRDAMLTIKQKNKYGSLELTVVSEYQDVSKISSKNVSNELFFDIDTAEKVALLTSDIRTQIVFEYPTTGRAFLIHHVSSNLGAVCKVSQLVFDKLVNAEEVIKNDNRRNFIYV